MTRAVRLADYSANLRAKGIYPLRMKPTHKSPGDLVWSGNCWNIVQADGTLRRKAVANG